MKISDVNNKFLTNKQPKQAAHNRINTTVTIFIVSTANAIGQFAKNMLGWPWL